MKPAYIYVSHFFPSPTNWRGAFCYDFVVALKKLNLFDVHVFVPGADSDYEYGGLVVHGFKMVGLPSAVLPNLFNDLNGRIFLNAVARAGIDLANVAVCHESNASLASLPFAVKKVNPICLAIMHHHDPGSIGVRIGRLHRFLWQRAASLLPRRKYFENMDLHVFNSTITEKSFRMFPDCSWTEFEDYRMCGNGLQKFKPLKLKDSVVLHYGVDKTIFYPDDTVVPSRKIKHQFRIGCVANLESWKDPVTLVKASVEVNKKFPVQLRVVGSGPDVPEMKRLASEGNLDLEILEEVQHPQLPAFYRSLDLFVLPSYFEGFGCVFTEAHSCGVPFITCEGQGMDDLISEQDRHVWLCKQRDADDLASKIMYYIENRPKQILTEDQDINKLVGTFAQKVLELISAQ